MLGRRHKQGSSESNLKLNFNTHFRAKDGRCGEFTDWIETYIIKERTIFLWPSSSARRSCFLLSPLLQLIWKLITESDWITARQVYFQNWTKALLLAPASLGPSEAAALASSDRSFKKYLVTAGGCGWSRTPNRQRCWVEARVRNKHSICFVSSSADDQVLDGSWLLECGIVKRFLCLVTSFVCICNTLSHERLQHSSHSCLSFDNTKKCEKKKIKVSHLKLVILALKSRRGERCCSDRQGR